MGSTNMKKFVNGEYIELTPEEIIAMLNTQVAIEADYWINVDYDEAVDTEIRKVYSVSQEFAIQRQKDKKPTEFAAYDAYCETCKEHVKSMKLKYSQEV